MSEYLNESEGNFVEEEQYVVPNTSSWEDQFAWAEEYWPDEVEDFMREWLLEKIDQAADEGEDYDGPEIGLTASQLDQIDYKAVETLYFSVATDTDNENLIYDIGLKVQEYNSTVNH